MPALAKADKKNVPLISLSL